MNKIYMMVINILYSKLWNFLIVVLFIFSLLLLLLSLLKTEIILYKHFQESIKEYLQNLS